MKKTEERKESRQLLWQKKQKSLGNCISCGKVREKYSYRCNVCEDKKQERQRKKKVVYPKHAIAYELLLKRVRWAKENGSEDYLFALLDMKKIFNRVYPLSKLFQLKTK